MSLKLCLSLYLAIRKVISTITYKASLVTVPQTRFVCNPVMYSVQFVIKAFTAGAKGKADLDEADRENVRDANSKFKFVFAFGDHSDSKRLKFLKLTCVK